MAFAAWSELIRIRVSAAHVLAEEAEGSSSGGVVRHLFIRPVGAGERVLERHGGSGIDVETGWMEKHVGHQKDGATDGDASDQREGDLGAEGGVEGWVEG